MNKLENFKQIADEIMSDINASNKLKSDTIIKIKSEKGKKNDVRAFQIKKPVIAFATIVLLFSFLNLSGLMKLNTQSELDDGLFDTHLMSEPNDQIQTLPGQSNSDQLLLVENNAWEFNSIVEARKYLGDMFLIPTFIPEGFKLQKIKGYGVQKETLDKVVLTYILNEQSFLVIEEKNSFPYSFVQFKVVDLDGINGYIKPNLSNSNDVIDTELYWKQEGINYQIIGFIEEDIAIKIAKSMINLKVQ